MIRIGVDFGGAKIEAAALDQEGRFLSRIRAANPGSYGPALETVRTLVEEAQRQSGARTATVGIAMPGSISPLTGRVRNANSTWLNDRPFDVDLERVLGRPVRLANDANCFALSEATDGAAQGARVVFGAILGSGCGGGVVVDGRAVAGANGVAGEWGHSPLPWASPGEADVSPCWCGRTGCLETWLSGTGFETHFAASNSGWRPAKEIAQAARSGEPSARAALDAYVDRLGRALAVVCDILDPDVIVCGGGMSNIGEIYAEVPAVIARWVFSDCFVTPVRPALHGDSSGVRGAAWLWPADSGGP